MNKFEKSWLKGGVSAMLLAVGHPQWEGLESRNAKVQHERKLQNGRDSWGRLCLGAH